jgi:phage shock protein A
MLSENVLTTLDNCGLKQVKKSFDLYALNQAVIYKLQEHEEKLDEHDQEIINLKTENEVLTRRITALEKMVGLQNNTYIEDLKVPF